MSGRVAEKELEKAEITVNKNMVPNDSRTAFKTSGLRIGTPAVTSRGFVEADMVKIVDLIDKVLSSASAHVEAIEAKEPTAEQLRELEEHKAVLEAVKEEVKKMTAGHPLNRY